MSSDLQYYGGREEDESDDDERPVRHCKATCLYYYCSTVLLVEGTYRYRI